jgi:predicted nucleotidyltransferase component of viral defense system
MMLTKDELKAFESTLGFNVWQLEKDYLQHLFLLFLSRRTKDQLVFKGGTALQKIYGLNRFSIDLIFLYKKNLKMRKLKWLLKILRSLGLIANVKRKKKILE